MTTFNSAQCALTPQDVQAVSPALASYTQKSISDDLWKRPGLSARDRSVVTVSALIARIQTIGMSHYFNIALDSGVKAGELSEIVTHLAFYSGWSNALSAVPILKDIFAHSVESGQTSSQASRPSFYHPMKGRRRHARRLSKRTSGPSLRASSSTRLTCYFAISGCVRRFDRETEVS
jgi:alkylhydroperoxidase/carboxymuconolactone decarboxylase family protein YurZ